METSVAGQCRPFGRICERLEFAVRVAPDLRRSCYYRVGGALVILLPHWVTGARAVEALIAYQICLAALEQVGEDRFVRGVADLLRIDRTPCDAPTEEAAD